MVDLLTALASGTIATLVPLYAGIFGPQILRWLVKSLHLFELDLNSEKVQLFFAAISAGILFWFLVDVLGDAALLDVSLGFTGGYAQLALAGMFGAGLLFLFLLEKALDRDSALDGGTALDQNQPSMVRKLRYGVAIAVALGIGFHSMGEGAFIGSVIPSSTTILDAIGGVSAGTAYVLHKLFEGFVVGVFALLAKSATGKKLAMLGLLAGIPTILGFFVGLLKLDSTYFFALGSAGGIYAELRIIPVFSSRDMKYSLIIAFLIGTYAMYIAGLFHGIQG